VCAFQIFLIIYYSFRYF